MSKKIIDVVIPAHEKDLDTLNYCIAGIRKNIAGVRRIIVVSKAKYTDKAEWFDEALFPFSYQEVASLVKVGIGWHLQQLLKLYSPLVIPNISENVLIVDSDTVFLRKVKFFSPEGLPLYNLSKDQDLDQSTFHQDSYANIAKVLPEVAQNLPAHYKNISGICHHMLFQKLMIEELMRRVEANDGSGDPFYKIFLKNSKESSYSVAEYNLYFYFLVALHPGKYQIRILRYKNTADFNLWKYRWRMKYHYCSFHSYMRENKKSLVQKIKESLSKKINRLFYFENWKIGILEFPIYEILRINPQVSWIETGEVLKFLADPFGFEIDGQKYVIFEDYCHLKKMGRIGIAPLNSNLTLGKRLIVLDDKKHLSYPFVINHAGRIFVVCESYKSGKLSLYEIDKTDLTVKKIRDIFTDKKIVDPTIIHYNDKFWMFYTIGDECNSKLYIAYADSLFDEFKEHAKNPVKNELSSSRSAGTPFMFENELYRPAQNCSKSYGGSIVINRITKLTEQEFSEEFVKEIMPDAQNFNCLGLHTLSSFGNLTLIDGKFKNFALYRPLLSLLRNLVRILK